MISRRLSSRRGLEDRSLSAAQVTLRGVTKVFPASAGGQAVHALGPIDLEIRKGEFFAVVGPSGCGKSTLLELIAGLTGPSEGVIEFEGRPIKNDIPGRRRRRVPGRRVLFLAHRARQRHVRLAQPRPRRGREGAAGRRRHRHDGAQRFRQNLSGATLRRHAPARLHRPHASSPSRASSCSTSPSVRSTSRPGC